MAEGSGRRRERGQATVELALVLPVIVVLVLVVAQVGLVVIDLVLVNHAAREAARAAAVEPTAEAAAVGARAGTRLDDARLSVAINGGTAPGDHVTATVRYRSPTEVPLIGPLVPDVVLEASVAMRVE